MVAVAGCIIGGFRKWLDGQDVYGSGYAVVQFFHLFFHNFGQGTGLLFGEVAERLEFDVEVRAATAFVIKLFEFFTVHVFIVHFLRVAGRQREGEQQEGR